VLSKSAAYVDAMRAGLCGVRLCGVIASYRLEKDSRFGLMGRRTSKLFGVS
jgi:hypothetical protein